MKRNSVALLLLVAASLCIGCHGGDAGGGGTVGLNNPQAGSDPAVSGGRGGDVSVCGRCDEDQSRVFKPGSGGWQSTQLNPGERKTLDQAMSGRKAAGKNFHLHAEVVNGALSFSSHDEATDVAGSKLSLAINPADGGEAVPVRVVATKEAADLLQKRSA